MRCPNCSERNSVAARRCKYCDCKLKSKSLSLEVAAGAALAVLALMGLGAGAVVLSGWGQPDQELKRAAEAVASVSGNSHGAASAKRQFSESLKRYLAKVGAVPAKRLARMLQTLLPAQTFEVHVVDLPRGMQVVEIDAALQASTYLLMKNSGGHTVTPLTGIEVFDDARILNEAIGPTLVVLGHSSGQPPHRPQVRVYALLPDKVEDQSPKLLPPIVGEGTARFARNGKDLSLALSMASIGQNDRLFAPAVPPEDAVVHQYLAWNTARYLSRYEYGDGPFTPLYVVARCLRYPRLAAAHEQYLSSAGVSFVTANASSDAGNFRVRRLPGVDGKRRYALEGNGGAFLVAVDRSGGSWAVSSIKRGLESEAALQAAAPAAAQPAVDTKPIQTDKLPAPAKIVVRTLGSSTHPVGQSPPRNASMPQVETPATSASPQASTKVTPETAAKAAQKETPSSENRDRKDGAQAPVKAAAGMVADMGKTSAKEAKAAVVPTPPQPARGKTPFPAGESKPAASGAATKATDKGEPAQIATNITAQSVKLRQTAGADGKTITELPRGTPVTVIGKQNGWYKVRCRDKEGYVYAGLVDYKKPDAYTTATLKRSGIVTDGKKNAVSRPQPGDRLVVVGGIENQKYKVRLANGTLGYVDKDALDVSIETPQFVP